MGRPAPTLHRVLSGRPKGGRRKPPQFVLGAADRDAGSAREDRDAEGIEIDHGGDADEQAARAAEQAQAAAEDDEDDDDWRKYL